MASNDRRIYVLLLYAFVAVYLVPIFPHGGSANELTRWATAASLVEKGSFEISWTEPLIGPNVDTAKIDGRTYSNKAPGGALVAAPFYAAIRLVTGPPDPSNIRISWYAMRLVVSTLPLFLLAIWLYRRGADAFSLCTLLFATPLFIYGLLLFSHVLAAILVYAAFRALFDDGPVGPRRAIFAGLASGLAVITEFPAVFAVAVFGAGLLFRERSGRWPVLGYYVLGGLPFAIFLFAYNTSLFGSPLSFSYAHESFPEWAEVAGRGVFGIGFPTISNIYLLLFSPARGLFFFSPILLLALTSIYRSPGRHLLRHKVKFAAIIISVLLLCGHGAAHGGWAAGARYLVFIIPLILDSFFEGEFSDRPQQVLKGGLLGLSVLFCVTPVLTYPFAPPEFSFPHNDLWFAFLSQESWFVPNLANVIGAPPVFLGVLPVLLAVAAALALVAFQMPKPRDFAVGIAIAAALFGAYVLLPGLEDAEGLRFRRASIAERYFRPAGRIEPYLTAAAARRDIDALRRINDFQWTIAEARAYAPDDFPYLEPEPLSESPRMMQEKAASLMKQGRTAETEALLRKGAEQWPFAACELRTNLAVVYYTTARKDAAMRELELVEPLVTPASRADCLRSQFLLGSLYRETGRADDARRLFNLFVTNSSSSADPEIIRLRNQLIAN